MAKCAVAGWTRVPKPPTAPTHKMKARRRHSLFVATCSCGWSEDVVSGLSAAMAMKRHEDGAQNESRRRANA